jgi:predicted ATP-grasp superfamily ATP-dependent carboligase
MLIGAAGRLALPAATQHLSDDGQFRYLGGSLPLPDHLNDRAQRLALRAVAPISGMAGYVGVDMVLGDGADESQDVAIEINSRLTTSYVGLRALAEFNLAETMLALALGKPLPERRYRDRIVTWSADGTVW